MPPLDPAAPQTAEMPQSPAMPASRAMPAPSAADSPPAGPDLGGPPPPPSLSLPKGGAAIRDIGEKFAVSAATGTATLTVPVATSASRAGFGPTLSLTYGSGSGNSPFGLGWKVTLPAITRQTDRGLPHYQDDPDQDTFILSGAEDLVPVRREHDGHWEQVPDYRTMNDRHYAVQCYRPRIEGLFARIERWRETATGETHWRSITSGNVTTIYGATADSRVADPTDPEHVFSWLICETYDDTGNAAAYEYAAEDSSGASTALASERNRTELSRSAARYPKRIRYGNLEPRLAVEHHGRPDRASHGQWMFEVVFDYGDHDQHIPLPEPTRPWPCRPDPFSTYRSGFEVRTYRRCHRILMFHHFPHEPDVGPNCVVTSTDLTYTSSGGSGMTTLASVVHTGYRRRPDGSYHTQSMPPVEFGYSQAVIGDRVHDLSPDTLENLPIGIDGSAYEWIDLDGEGLSGVLARQGDAWFYKANLGEGRFAPVCTLATQPAMAGPGRRQELLDLSGSGHLDLVEFGGPVPGYCERTDDRSWRAFRSFPSLPNIDWNDPDLRMVDLDGDGLADVLITCDDAFTWHPGLGHDGFGPGQRTYPALDEEHGPRVVFADPEQTIYLADMCGDGLSDLVRVRNGDVCYWPNRGYGRFGAKVTMDRSPWLDRPDHFDQRRVRLADVDGTGTADLTYLHPDGARLYLNQSGNGYSGPHALPQAFPRLDGLAHVMVADLLGRGTACLVWSSSSPGDSGRQLRYLDLMAEGKPYLLTEVVNNLGAETRISYAPSTRFYLADQAAGHPWVTRLNFPVQVVDRVETIDRINRNRFTTRHAYHDGYYDGFEREFRGFGMVEQWDTEELAVLEADNTTSDFTNLDPATDLPPVLTRTWLHTGVFPGDDRVTRMYEHEYYHQPGGGDPDLPDTTLPTTLRVIGQQPQPWQLSRIEAREAYRALKGMPLREEVYALDGSKAADRPYAVTENTYSIELLQPATPWRPDGPVNYHAIFLTHARETVTAHYERALYQVRDELRADPRITHDLVLEIDDYGNPLRTASVGYGRRYPDPSLATEDQETQSRLRLTYTQNGYTNPIAHLDAYRTPMPSRTRSFEIVGVHPHARRGGAEKGDTDGLFDLAELRDELAAISTDLPFQDWNVDHTRLPAPARRLISHATVQYRSDDLTGPLPIGNLEPLALPYRSYHQAFTDSLITELYADRVDADMLSATGYVRDGGTWWTPSGQVSYSPQEDVTPDGELAYAKRHFFLPHQYRDPFGNTTAVTYDRYDLLVAQTRDAIGNLVTVGERDHDNRLTTDGNDYRVLAPRLVSNPNRNRAVVAFDALGRVSGTAIMGKQEEQLGDSLDDFDPDPPPAAIAAYFTDPFASTHVLLGHATTRVLYDLDAYQRTRHESQPQPAGVAMLARETHVSDVTHGEWTKVQRSFGYSDGFGREVQHKGQAAAGPVTDHGPETQHRWIGSGWTVFNNKGKPVRTYEPFFTATPSFEFARAVGVSPVLFYDPAGRVVATLHPNNSYDKTVFDPWHQDTWDVNDTVLLDPDDDPDVAGYTGRYLAGVATQPGGWLTWYAQRSGGALGRAEQRTAEQTVLHAGTRTRTWMDALGRTFLTVAHNHVRDDGRVVDQYCRTHSLLDIQGNQHEVRDPLDRAVMRYDYTMLSAQVAHAGMDTGGGQLLPDVSGKPVYLHNSRGFTFRSEYDALRRPTRTYATGPCITDPALLTRTEYGEALTDAETTNLRTRVARQYDGAGVTTNQAYDFKGNLLDTRRQLSAEYREVVNWARQVQLEERQYLSHTTYDALNRPITMTSPDASVLVPSYDPSSMLDRLEGRLRGAAETTTFVEHLEYNARGQRTLILYGNGSASEYAYDPLTFRLIGLTTVRGKRHLQDLHFTYDPIGNPTLVHDHAQQRIFFRNQVVDPSARYAYDALYRLIEATGREHLGQTAGETRRAVPPGAADAPRLGLPQPGDGTAMARYAERYAYDKVGNLLRVAHRSADPAAGGWTRSYRYREPSLLEPGRESNRLTGTNRADAATTAHRVSYDEQGNTTAMPEIQVLQWDQSDRLHKTVRQHTVRGEIPEATYFVYDMAGQRVRKVTDRACRIGQNARKCERVYVGTFEVYREYGSEGAVTLERETLTTSDSRTRVALVETRTVGEDRGQRELIRYQLDNQLNSSVLELDRYARVITFEEYYPYGSTSQQAVRARTETPKRYRYTGKERDIETGLYYFGARYYAPWLGRWVSCDPAGLIDGPVLYAYARDNPVTRTDRIGTQSQQSEPAAEVDRDVHTAARHALDASPPRLPATHRPAAPTKSVAPVLPAAKPAGKPPSPLSLSFRPPPPPPPDRVDPKPTAQPEPLPTQTLYGNWTNAAPVAAKRVMMFEYNQQYHLDAGGASMLTQVSARVGLGSALGTNWEAGPLAQGSLPLGGGPSTLGGGATLRFGPTDTSNDQFRSGGMLQAMIMNGPNDAGQSTTFGTASASFLMSRGGQDDKAQLDINPAVLSYTPTGGVLGPSTAPGLVMLAAQGQYSVPTNGGNQVSVERLVGFGAATAGGVQLFGARLGGGVGFTHTDPGDKSSSFSINANAWLDPTNRGVSGGFQLTTTFGLRLGPL